MLAFLGGVCVVATSLIFLGGYAARDSMILGGLLSGAGGACLGVIYASLTRLAATDWHVSGHRAKGATRRSVGAPGLRLVRAEHPGHTSQSSL